MVRERVKESMLLVHLDDDDDDDDDDDLFFWRKWTFYNWLFGVYLFMGDTVANNIHFDCTMFHKK